MLPTSASQFGPGRSISTRGRSGVSLIEVLTAPRVISLLAAILFPIVAIPAAEPSLEEIQAGYRQSVTSIATAHVEYSLEEILKTDNLPAGVPSRSRYDCLWAQDGDKRMLKFVCLEGGIGSGTVVFRSFDGTRQWQIDRNAKAPSADPAFMNRRSVRDDERFQLWRNPGNFLGQTFAYANHPFGRESLATLFDHPGAHLTGPQEFDGATCYGVEFPDVDGPGGRSVAVAAWFDPEAGYLPRRIQVAGYKPADETRPVLDGQPSEQATLYGVARFEQIASSNLWFPMAMWKIGRVGDSNLLIANVSLNEPLASSVFEPPPEYATSVVDINDRAQVADYERWRMMRRAEPPPAATLEPPEVPANLQSAVKATPAESSAGRWLALVSGVILVCVSGWCWARSRQPRKS